MDRISQLPQPMLHHILSFLSQEEAVQTCLLSESWRYLGSTRPCFEFSESSFNGNRRGFMSVLDNTLQRYHDQKLSIQELKLNIWKVDPESISLFGKWIPIVMLSMGVKTFQLIFILSGKYFDMPSVIFQAKSLRTLYLTCCKLNHNSIVRVLFNHLQTLRLKNVHISDETLEFILSSCPLIESLALEWCELLRTINVNKACNLKHFGYSAYYWNKSSTEIYIPSTLETIRIEYYANWFLHHNNNYFSHLKSLNLIDLQLSVVSFDKFSSKYCPCLEKLELRFCNGFEEFQLSSRSIKHLDISFDYKIKELKAAIDAPNILYFRFSSAFLPSISFTTTFSEWESHIAVQGNEDYDDLWLLKLNELLKALSQSQISLDFRPVEYHHIEDTDGGGSYKPVEVENLSLRGSFSTFCLPAFLNCLFRICHPRYIVMFLDFNSCATHSERETKQPSESSCMFRFKKSEITTHCYIWTQDLEKFRLDVWDKNAEEWCRLQGTRLPESACPNKPDIRFRLTWRELSSLA